jgi:murein DD-endopeptidase MepM/ murein hydrolase activator NlpD
MGMLRSASTLRLRRALALFALATGSAIASHAGGLGHERECLDAVPELCLLTEKHSGGARLSVTNTSPVPYTVRVAIDDLENLRSPKRSPFRAVVGPMQTKRLAAFHLRDPLAPFGYDLHWGAGSGSMLARHDEAWHYRMPFGGKTPYPVSQGANGDMSHMGPFRYSFDFAVPRGTPVLAARSGVVVRVKDGSGHFGRVLRSIEDANAVDVLHRDGTIATYAHLDRGIPVVVGDAVATGDTLGRSGDTGASTGPHLHFMVWQRKSDLSQTTLPIRFHDGTHTGFVPGVGIAYAPGCAASGMGCPREEGPPPSEMWPASEDVRPAPSSEAMLRPDGSCLCPNGAVIQIESLSCNEVCGS